MSQKTLNSYFSVKKRPISHNAAKRKKVGNDQDITSAVITTFKDDHVIPPAPSKGFTVPEKDDGPNTSIIDLVNPSDGANLLSTPTSNRKSQATNSKSRKRDAFGQSKEGKESPLNSITRFTVGKSGPSSSADAKRKLQMDKNKSAIRATNEDTSSSPKKVVTFLKAGHLSPSKPIVFTLKENVTFEKKGTLSPQKKSTKSSHETDVQKKIGEVYNKLEKCTPAEIKTKIGTVRKLSDLKARIQELNKDKLFANTGENKHRRQLFSPPKLSKEAVTLEIETVKAKPSTSPISSPVKSGIKASPRKVPQFLNHEDLRVPDSFMPLPKKYKFLADVFRSVDDVVGMKFNRREIVRVSCLKSAVQNIIRKVFENIYLQQIRCVFPKAYAYTWEKILDRLGRHSSGEYELHMVPELDYNKSACASEAIDQKGSVKLGPREKVERLKLFNHSLLQIAKDYHKDFLINLGWTKEELDKEFTKWHPKFDVEEHCPEIDTVDFPVKPHVEKMSNAKDMIVKFAGINPRLKDALHERETSLQATNEPLNDSSTNLTKIKNPEENSNPNELKLLKGLRGLPPALIKKILEKEKAKNVQEITQNPEKRKRIELMQELISVAPYIANCHRSIKNGAAVEVNILTKVTADSYGHGKTKEDIMKLLKMFLNLVPECMELRTYDRISYVKKKKDSPDINNIKVKLQKLVDQEKQS